MNVPTRRLDSWYHSDLISSFSSPYWSCWSHTGLLLSVPLTGQTCSLLHKKRFTLALLWGRGAGARLSLSKKIFNLDIPPFLLPFRFFFKCYLKFSVRPPLTTCLKLHHFTQQFPVFLPCLFSVVLIAI